MVLHFLNVISISGTLDGYFQRKEMERKKKLQKKKFEQQRKYRLFYTFQWLIDDIKIECQRTADDVHIKRTNLPTKQQTHK